LDRMNLESDYILTNYRFYDGSKFVKPDNTYAIFHEIYVDSKLVLTIYRRLDNHSAKPSIQ
jgi:hypothetical protein